MIRSTQQLYAEQVKLTKWFAAISLVFGLVALSTVLWIHSILLLVVAAMLGPIFVLLTLVFLVITLVSKSRQRNT